MEKLVIHITFHYSEERIVYLHKIINEALTYPFETHVFIHSNKQFSIDNAKVIDYFIPLNLKYQLSWKCRELMFEQQFDHDYFMYVEDDILVPKQTIEYWLKYSPQMVQNKYNLGFVRIEKDDNDWGTEYIVDLPNKKLDKVLIFKWNNVRCAINDVNDYCAFWIYTKSEMWKFINSNYFVLRKNKAYGIRETQGIGFMRNYKSTLIVIDEDNCLDEGCKIYHLTNNYINDNSNEFSTIK